MEEEIIVSESEDKASKYESLLPQIIALIRDEPDVVANQANLVAALKTGMGFFWVGFYKVAGDELVLGPFQGPVACTRIARGRGVCGTVWEKKQTIIVPDVDKFPGHIACSPESRSEIVVPVIRDKEVLYVLDVDSTVLNDFNQTDKIWLEKLLKMAEEYL